MQTPSINKNAGRLLMISFVSTALVFLLTAFHHYYGAIAYQTPWRKQVVLQGGLVLLVCFLFSYLFKRYERKIFLSFYLTLSFTVFGLAIGIIEGAYNHLTKDILYFSGLNLNTWRMLFPSPAYEIPNDFIFESTGILQFFFALIQIRYLWKVYKANYKKNPKGITSPI